MYYYILLIFGLGLSETIISDYPLTPGIESFPVNSTHFVNPLYHKKHYLAPASSRKRNRPLRLARAAAKTYKDKQDSIESKLNSNLTEELKLTLEDITMMKADVRTRYMAGYDCNKPQSIQPLSSFIADPCTMDVDKDQTHYTASFDNKYQIVQYETRREYEGYRCEKYVSRYTFHCGNADHGTAYPEEIYFKEPSYISRESCQQMHITKHYTDDQGNRHKVLMDHMNKVDYYMKGSRVFASSEVIYGAQLSCEGAEMNIKGRLIPNMVSRVVEEVIFRKEKIIHRVEDDQLLAFYNNIELPCGLNDR